MRMLDFLSPPDVNRGVSEYKNTRGAILLDVRTAEEYREGHIPKSINIPVQVIDKVRDLVDNKDTALFVYCHSGARSRRATEALARMGYTRVNNIGGISAYRGKVEG